MTNTELIAKIKAEIERLQKYNHCMADNAINSNMRNFYDGEEDCCKQLLSFLSTLESEKPMNPEAAMKELDEKIAIVKQRGTWDGVDVDKYMDEVRGREPEKPMEQEKEVEPCHRTRKKLAEWSKTQEGRESYEKVAEEMRNDRGKQMKYILTEKLKAEIEKRQEARQDIRDSASWENEYWPESDFCTRDDEDDAILSIITSLQQEQPEDVVVVSRAFLDVLSKTPYNNKPITDAQIIVKQLLLFLETPSKYNPDAILEQSEVDFEKEL